MMPLEYMEVKKCIETPPPPLDYVIPGLVSGTVGSLIAPGATGKSWLALQIAAAICGADTLELAPPGRGRVLYIASEDPRDVLHQRIHTLAARLNQSQRESLIENMQILPTLGKTGDLLDGGQTAGAIARAGEGCRLVILDTLSRWHTGDENARADAARVMRELEKIATGTGAAVMFLHHTSKSAALDGQGSTQQAARGSSVWIDESRHCVTLTKCSLGEAKDLGIDDDLRDFFVKYTIAKANYIPPQPARWLRRREGGLFEPVEVHKPSRPGQKNGGKGGDDDDF